MDREAIEEAIEVLEDASAEMLAETGDENYYAEAITILRQALETEQKTAISPGKGTGFNYFRALDITVLRQAQEPVAWLSEGGDVSRSKRYMDEMGFKCNPLYTAPPKKQWVGLTLKEVLIHRHLIDWTSEWSYLEFAREIERALKEKNHG